MIQRIAEEAKLTDLDINAEERVSPKTTSTNEKGMNALIFSLSHYTAIIAAYIFSYLFRFLLSQTHLQ